MSDRLIAIARRIQARAWNAPGSDKTWVLDALRQYQRFMNEVRRSERLEQG